MTDTPIEVLINGEIRTVPAGLSLSGLLRHLEIKENRVAVEFDRQIVKPDQWETTFLKAGSEVEVVHFVGGGR